MTLHPTLPATRGWDATAGEEAVAVLTAGGEAPARFRAGWVADPPPDGYGTIPLPIDPPEEAA